MKLWIAVALAIAGCVEHVQLSNDGALPGLVSLAVTPGDTTLSITDLAAPRQVVGYIATGTFVDGSTRDVTQLVQWDTDNPAPGSFVSAGSYATSNVAAGHVVVRAASGAIAGTATLTIIVSVTISDSEFPPPAGVEGLFGSEIPVVTDPMHSPSLRYPSDNTMFPQALAPVLFQYMRGMANDAFRLAFDSDVLHLVVFSGTDRWQPDKPIWSLIELSHLGSAVTVTLQAAASTAPGTVYGSLPTTLRFAASSADGAIYYWSDAKNAVVRGPLDSPVSAQLYPTGGDKTCVGCHAISRDGRMMALGYGGETLQTVDVAALTTNVSATQKLPMGWATFSPAADRVLVADKGVLTLYDAVTGAPIGPGNGVVPLNGVFATHPDWSPDGSAIVVALTTTAPMNMDMKGGAIARIAYGAAGWGSPEILVTSASSNDNSYFPRWSPDGKFIAYIHATSSSHAAPTAELRLIAASGGTPVALRTASHRVGVMDDVPNLADTMPTWAPGRGGIAWIAFASTRPYGLIKPAPGASQIWIAGVDLTATGDPSFAAFWLPSQGITALNNNPIWAISPTPIN